MTQVDISVEADGIYVNGCWVIDLDHARIEVADEEEARYYSTMWDTAYCNEGVPDEQLWWVALPDDVTVRVRALARALGSNVRLLRN